MKRIHILGGPGSGKTALASRLAQALGSESITLDAITYEDPLFTLPRTRTSRIELVRDYVGRDSWVAEGVYFSWVGQSFKHADRIVVLNLPKSERDRNIRSKLNDRFPEGAVNEQYVVQLARLLKSNEEYDSLFKQRIHGFIAPHAAKTDICNSTAEAVERILMPSDSKG